MTPDTGEDDGVDTSEVVSPSPKGHLRLKRGGQLRNELVATLALDADELCQELGQLNCFDHVHPLALGGVAPYEEGIHTPSSGTIAASPGAYGRIALSGCIQRITKDLADADHAILLRATVSPGEILSIDDAALRSMVERLFQRGLLRIPTENEQQAFIELYADFLEDAKESPLKDWAILSCYAVLSSAEFVFY